MRMIPVFSFAAVLSVECSSTTTPVREQLRFPTGSSKVVVSSEVMAGVVEISTGPTLAASNVFTASFIDSARGEAPAPSTVERYRVDFYLPDETGWMAQFKRQRLRLAYVVYFVPEANGPGKVLLPGVGDPWSAWNHRIVVHSQLEGRWSYANVGWGEDLRTRIGRQQRVETRTTCPTTYVIAPSDSAYADVVTLRDTLVARGVGVICAFHGTRDGVLGAKTSATLLTERGPFAASFFPTADVARSISITSTVRDGILVTVLRRPGWPRSDTASGGMTAAMFAHDRVFFDAFGAFAIDSALRSAFGVR